ncbi:MAG: enoyl-CoA hydratase family protein [Sphingomonas sp.]|nr:enoyl-CoA hydratase family protein [Sphingomonas sp.]MDX3884227.1 enoyl-CoA hydratase family protein [Sphingomonas sp.]
MPIRIHVEDNIGEVIVDHPPVNALDSATVNELADIIAEVGQREDVRCILIRAVGKGFNGGADIKEMQANPERIVNLNRGNYRTFKAIHTCPVPVVSAVQGFVIGTGIGICGASDVVIAAENAYFSLPEVDRGAMGGASHLQRMFPIQKVRAAFFTGGRIPAAEAYRLGAVEMVVSVEELHAKAREFCAIIASKSRKALTTAKEALNGIEPRDVDQGYRWEQGFTLEMYMHEDSQKSRDAFVHEKGQAAKF